MEVIKAYSKKLFIKLNNSNYLGYFILFTLSLIVMLPLFSNGYIFTLDYVTHENAKESLLDYLQGFSEDNNGVYLTPLSIPNFFYMLALFILGNIFSVEFFQKLFLFFLLFFSGFSAYYACPTKKVGKLFAGILYMINPFTFVRFLAGHTLLLISYAFFPLFLKSLIDFSESIGKINRNNKIIIKDICKVSILATFCISTSHYLPLIIAIIFSFSIFFIFGKKQNNLKITAIINYILVLLIFLALNFYWIIPIAGETSPLHKIEQFSELDLELFSSKPSLDFNIIFNVISLHGFWRGGYDYAKYHLKFWPLIFILILFFSIHGFLIYKNRIKFAFLIIVIASSLFSIGIGFKPIENLIKFSYSNFSFLMGLREPHKLLVILCLFYSYFGGVGVSDVISSIKLRKKFHIVKILLIALILIFPIIYSYTMLFGFNKSLIPTNYPEDWYEVNNLLNRDEDDFQVLFFPWHLYMDFKWIKNYDKRINNPARVFFNKPIISAENIETGGIGPQTNNPTLLFIEFLLSRKDNIKNFGKLVALANVKYILLTKEADWQEYLWLKNQEDLEIIKETENFIIFKNKNYRGKIYIANKTIKLDNLEEIIKISEKDDIGNIAFANENKYYDCENTSLNYRKISPLEYEIILYSNYSEYNSKKCLIVFITRYSNNWKINNISGFNSLNITNLFEYNVTSNDLMQIKIKYENFIYNFYMISLAIFLLLIICLIR